MNDETLKLFMYTCTRYLPLVRGKIIEAIHVLLEIKDFVKGERCELILYLHKHFP